ncbi:MAG: hypothetical protein HY706_10020 [Candidatus Hydrogenedentes bacterium]|nr:hypothetical protein [Candidatus Hydrogenedentota bacterium]
MTKKELKAQPAPSCPQPSGKFTVRVRPCSSVFVLLAFLAFHGQTDALTMSRQLSDLTYTVYAPDWTWQGRNINIVVSVENPSDAEKHLHVALTLPSGKESDFDYAGENEIDLTLPPRSVQRCAFVNLYARNDVPRGSYDFELMLNSDHSTSKVSYRLRTIRGALVGPGKPTLLLLTGITVIVSLVFATVFRLISAPQAWRTPGAPFEGPKDHEAWIHRPPQ